MSPKEGSNVAKRAQAHPDFAKWEAIAKAAESEDSEDALAPERRVEASEDRLYKEVMLYWMRRGIGADASGIALDGEHLKKPQELARRYGVDVGTAAQIVEDAHQEVERELAKQPNFDLMTVYALKRIEKLENDLSRAA
jgi:hypothetical protein